MSRPNTRQELYDRIRTSSLDEVIAEEMVRLGFWPAADQLPEDPVGEIKRKGELERQLRALRTEATRLQDEAAMKREARRRRMAEAKARREQTKARRERERAERAQRWRERAASEVLHLGRRVSTELGQTRSNVDRLTLGGLPVLHDAASIAAAMGIDVPRLRFLAYDRPVAKVHHYQRFLVPKKTGGDRLISAPMPRLKRAQRWIHENILARLELHPAAHGFVPSRSICTNARPHVGSAVVINLDLADFFPSVTWVRVRGMFKALGYSPQAATILALICTERDVDEIELDGEAYFVGRGPRSLPQGSPASPAITNWLCRRLDARLGGLARKLGVRYTRYADDLTFSSNAKDAPVSKLLGAVNRFVAEEGFAVRRDKTRIMRAGRRQEVTGVVVNDKPGVDRRTLRRFRATLFQIERDGPEGKHWGRPGTPLFASLLGYAAYVAMVDADKGAPLAQRVKALADRHGYKQQSRSYPRRETIRVSPTERRAMLGERDPWAEPRSADASAKPPPSKKKWWQFWK